MAVNVTRAVGALGGNWTTEGGSWTTQSMARPPGSPPLDEAGGGGREETEEEEEMTRSGIPIRLIWVPYLVLTLIIISLMVASFVRFHFKHGHKYLRRREELMLRHNQATQAAQAAAAANQGDSAKPPPNGGPTLTLSPREPPASGPQPLTTSTNNHHSTINHHRHLPSGHPGHHSHQGHPGPPLVGGGVLLAGGPPVVGGGRCSTLPPPHKVVSLSSKAPHPSSSSAAKKTGPGGRGHGRRNRPIAFARNANGSMVDLRVAGVDSVSMFKSSFCPARPPLPPLHWADRGARPPPYRTLHSPGSGFSDEDDDHVLLIHQSKV